MTYPDLGSALADAHALLWALPSAIDPALVAFALVIAASPGPSNIVLLGVGSRVGTRRGLPLLAGMAIGYAILWGGAGSGLRALAALDPMVVTAARWVAIAFMLRLAWRLATVSDGANGEERLSVGVWGGIVFQAANPKAWVSAAAAASVFCTPEIGVPGHAVVFALVAFVCVLIGCGAWLAAGEWGAAWLRRSGPRRVLNGTLAVTLLAAIVPVALAT